MSTPVLWVLAGPNGAGKTTLFEHVLGPVAAGLEFVNADRIAAERWPGAEMEHAYEAARIATARRTELLEATTSFITETVFSHPSKLQLMREASMRGYLVTLHVVLVPLELAVARVANRTEHGGHDVPEEKIRGRFDRLWGHIREGIAIADEAFVYDNSLANDPLRQVASFQRGRLLGAAAWPNWVAAELLDVG